MLRGKILFHSRALEATSGACNMIGELLELLGPQRPVERVGRGKLHTCFLTHRKQKAQGLYPEVILSEQRGQVGPSSIIL